MADEQFYNKQIGIAYWYVTHKQAIQKILLSILLVIILVLTIFNLYWLIYNFGIYGRGYSELIQSLTTLPKEYLTLREIKLPQPINVGLLSTFVNGNNFDIVAEISNANIYWYATFNYQFRVGDKLTAPKPGFILPGQNKRLIDLNIENGNSASELVIDELVWNKEINFKSIEEQKYKMEIKNISLIPPSQLAVGDKLQVSQVVFEAENQSNFNYANVAFQIYLLNKGNVEAVGQIPSGVLKSGQTQTYRANFFQNLSKITDISVVPEINILDSKAFIKF